VGGKQLQRFLDRLGAATLVLISPPSNYSLSGLLALADEVARNRPGAVLIHDLEADDPLPLATMLTRLHAGDGHPQALPISPALVTYASPEQLHLDGDLGGLSSVVSPGVLPERKYLVSNRRGSALDEADLLPTAASDSREAKGRQIRVQLRVGEMARGQEAWEGPSQRVLERYAADQLRTGSAKTEVGEAARKGRAQALSFVTELLDKDESGC
jgi:hypothetical protein